MFTSDELIDMMEAIGYDCAFLPERNLYAFDPGEEALPVLSPVTVNFPDPENNSRFEVRVWFDIEDCEASAEKIALFAARFNWIHAPWKFLFDPDEFDFCVQSIWPGDTQNVEPETFFNDLLTGNCLVHCLFAAIAALEEGMSPEMALHRLEEEYATLSNMIDTEAFEDDLAAEPEQVSAPKKKAAAKKTTAPEKKTPAVKKETTAAKPKTTVKKAVQKISKSAESAAEKPSEKKTRTVKPRSKTER